MPAPPYSTDPYAGGERSSRRAKLTALSPTATARARAGVSSVLPMPPRLNARPLPLPHASQPPHRSRLGMRPLLIKGIPLSHRATVSRMLVSGRRTSPPSWSVNDHHAVEGHIGPEASITFSPSAITVSLSGHPACKHGFGGIPHTVLRESTHKCF